MIRLKKTIKGLLLYFLIIVFSGVAFEILSERFLDYQQRRQNERIVSYYPWSCYTQDGHLIGRNKGILKLMLHPKVGHVNFPNQKTPSFSINSSGFRNPEIQPKVQGRKRIIIIGGSSAFGAGLKNDSETCAAFLEKKIGAAEVINAAVIGHCSGQELIYLFTELIDLEPDLIIALDGCNDYGKAFGSNRWLDFNAADQTQNELATLSLLIYSDFSTRCANAYQVIFPNSKVMLWRISNKIVKWVNNFSDKDKKTRSGPEEDRLNAVCASYTRNIMKMNRLAKMFNANFLCVLQPTKGCVATQPADKDNYLNKYFEFCAYAKQYFNRHEIHYINLNDYAAQFKEGMFMDGIHLNKDGNETIADIIKEKLNEAKLI